MDEKQQDMAGSGILGGPDAQTILAALAAKKGSGRLRPDCPAWPIARAAPADPAQSQAWTRPGCKDRLA